MKSNSCIFSKLHCTGLCPHFGLGVGLGVGPYLDLGLSLSLGSDHSVGFVLVFVSNMMSWLGWGTAA